MVNVILGGQIVATSKNLAGVINYARKHPVTRVETAPYADSKGSLRVFYANGAECKSLFVSHVVMFGWVRARRIFKNAEIVNY
jgi:hypothetical protein